MENIYDNLHPQTRRMHRLMTSCERVHRNEFLRIISSSSELRKFAKMLTSDSDLFVKIITDRVGSYRVIRILERSDETNTILFYPILKRFTEIMTQIHGHHLTLRILDVCNIHQIKIFCHITYRHALVLARDEYGCIILKTVITIADDLFKDEFLDLIANCAYWLSMDALGVSLIQHVLKLDFTHKTIEDTRFHKLMAEFDEILSTSHIEELHRLASKLTSDADIFAGFIKTRRGSLMVQIILGKSEKIDTIFFEAIKRSFTDVITEWFGFSIVSRTTDVFKTRGNTDVYDEILRLIGVYALELTTNVPVGNVVVQSAININDLECTEGVALRLHNHYVELSFLKHGSNVVEKLLGDSKTMVALVLTVREIVKCDEDTLVRLAKDEYGNKVLKKTLEVAKERNVDSMFNDLVDKLKPFLDRLRGSHGENIAAIIDSETETIKDRIVSEGNN